MNSNTGNWNTGERNTGDGNTGDRNTGNWNTGERNTGNCNTGYGNTGYSNTGDRNTGYRNTGDSNTGNWNTGESNTGDWNTGDRNTGYCNSITPKEILVFNKLCKKETWDKTIKPSWMYSSLIQWIDEDNMSDKEKEAYPTYITTGGYLKVYSNLKQVYIEAWDKASKADKLLTFKLPNFGIEVFKEIFGFTPIIKDKVKITVEGKDIYISRESAKTLNLIK